LGSTRAVALAHGDARVSDADGRAIDAAARIVLGVEDGPPADLAPCPPDGLAVAMLDDEEDGIQAVRILPVMSLAVSACAAVAAP
jgi:hypothetical protein